MEQETSVPLVGYEADVDSEISADLSKTASCGPHVFYLMLSADCNTDYYH